MAASSETQHSVSSASGRTVCDHWGTPIPLSEYRFQGKEKKMLEGSPRKLIDGLSALTAWLEAYQDTTESSGMTKSEALSVLEDLQLLADEVVTELKVALIENENHEWEQAKKDARQNYPEPSLYSPVEDM